MVGHDITKEELFKALWRAVSEGDLDELVELTEAIKTSTQRTDLAAFINAVKPIASQLPSSGSLSTPRRKRTSTSRSSTRSSSLPPDVSSSSRPSSSPSTTTTRTTSPQDPSSLNSSPDSPPSLPPPRTLLTLAALKGRVPLVTHLIRQNAADPDLGSSSMPTPLHYAVVATNSALVKTLLVSGASVSVLDGNGWSPLRYAVMNGWLEGVITLLDAGADPDARIWGTYDPVLSAAIGVGHQDVAAVLIGRGADIDAHDSMGTLNNTPLHTATVAGNRALVSILLERGARVDPVNEWGHTPLMLACAASLLNIMYVLVRYGASMNSGDTAGNTPLHIAAGAGSVRAVDWLLERGLPVDARNAKQSTPLHLAAAAGQLKAVSYLLTKRNAPLNATNAYGWSPTHAAVDAGQLEVLALLLASDADVTQRAIDVGTPLHLAVLSNSPKAVQMLITMGASIYTKDPAGRTPRELALVNGLPRLAATIGGFAEKPLVKASRLPAKSPPRTTPRGAPGLKSSGNNNSSSSSKTPRKSTRPTLTPRMNKAFNLRRAAITGEQQSSSSSSPSSVAATGTDASAEGQLSSSTSASSFASAVSAGAGPHPPSQPHPTSTRSRASQSSSPTRPHTVPSLPAVETRESTHSLTTSTPRSTRPRSKSSPAASKWNHLTKTRFYMYTASQVPRAPPSRQSSSRAGAKKRAAAPKPPAPSLLSRSRSLLSMTSNMDWDSDDLEAEQEERDEDTPPPPVPPSWLGEVMSTRWTLSNSLRPGEEPTHPETPRRLTEYEFVPTEDVVAHVPPEEDEEARLTGLATYGETSELMQGEGEDTETLALLAGLRSRHVDAVTKHRAEHGTLSREAKYGAQDRVLGRATPMDEYLTRPPSRAGLDSRQSTRAAMDDMRNLMASRLSTHSSHAALDMSGFGDEVLLLEHGDEPITYSDTILESDTDDHDDGPEDDYRDGIFGDGDDDDLAKLQAAAFVSMPRDDNDDHREAQPPPKHVEFEPGEELKTESSSNRAQSARLVTRGGVLKSSARPKPSSAPAKRRSKNVRRESYLDDEHRKTPDEIMDALLGWYGTSNAMAAKDDVLGGIVMSGRLTPVDQRKSRVSPATSALLPNSHKQVNL